jgi:putative transposase
MGAPHIAHFAMCGFRHHRTVSGSPSHSHPCRHADCVSKRLHRYYGTHDLHFITSSCYRRRPELGSPWRRDLFVKVLEEARRKYRFVVHGYVVMPEHFHVLISEPEVGDPSVVMKVIKERFSRRVNRRRKQPAAEQGVLWERVREPVWQRRFYDFNVWSAHKQIDSYAICTATR